MLKKNKKQNKPKVLVILGPTASGKTKLGVDLARKFKGEIISADSRQVFRGMDIGSGKDLEEYGKGKDKVKYHLIDISDPKKDFDLAKYQKLAFKAIENILKRKKLPIIVGGSGLYVQAIIDNYDLSSFGANRKKRDELEKLGAKELFKRLEKLKQDFAKKINNSDKNNARRLARYLEIVENGGIIDRRLDSHYEFLILGLDFPNEILRERVSYRLLKRLEEGMIAEVKNLKEAGLSNERLESFGLEYRYINRHLNGELSYNYMLKELEIASYRFAKRQKTWFKRFEKQGGIIYWLNKKIDLDKLINGFLLDL
ncbi:tRNA (adenosine(37)-N6)-dimethylallyltransferase MiaA [Candidatus Falkowbacteria bacterium]|nr:tRNA (adenosine(37)-N6)-dimethylallyltransferase MiaA [Candidatus Falkowbacteria bacterium]